MRKVNGYPLIKCGNLLTSLKTGPFGSALNTEHWTTNGTAVLTIGSLGEQSIIEDELLYISDSYAEKLNPYRVNEGDIVFSRVADIGRAQLIDKKQDGWVISSNLMKMTINKDLIRPEFLYIAIKDSPVVAGQLKSHSNGNGRLLVNSSIVKNIKIPTPELAVQDKLIGIISCWDNAIEKTEALIAAKEKQFEWLMEKLFKPNDTWTPYRLGELFDNRKETHNTDLPLVSITREKGVIPHSETNRKDNSSEDKSKYLRIRPDDIGYNTMRMWQGVSALSGIDGIVSPAYTICIPKKIVDPEFMAFLFKTKPMIHKFYRYSQGLTSDTWNLKFHHFCEVKAEIPDIKTQIEIAQILNTAKQEINLLKKTLEQYRTQKRGLMQKLLTGEWQVSNAQIGAESELQERTKENIA
jgi:type I restriction enzyme S subunit